MAQTKQERITKRSLDCLKADGRDFFVWDSDISGFGIRIKPSGVKSFIVRYRNGHGKERRITLGRYGHITVEQARKLAHQELGKIATGEDPQSNKSKASRMTVEDLCLQYYEDAEAGKVLYRGKSKKASTLAIDRGRIHRHIIPMLGKVYVKDLTRHQVENFMYDVIAGKTATTEKTKVRGLARVRDGPGTAKKCVSLLGAIYSYAIRKEYIEHNPCRDIDKPADGIRERFLNAGEYHVFGLALYNAIDHRLYGYAPHAILIAALTGCRRSEITSMVRSVIDIDGSCLRFADTKTGAQMRPCGARALTILERVASEHTSDWVFPAIGNDMHIVNIRKPMDAMCKEAGISGVTPHTLRHSYATVAHELGYSELTIAGLLGHRAGSVTGRYAHHVDHALADAADRVCMTILKRLGPDLSKTLQIQYDGEKVEV